jgi:hypothetical protein
MKRTLLAHQHALVAAGARPCAFAYGQRWSLGVAGVEDTSMLKPNGITATTALGRHPV